MCNERRRSKLASLVQGIKKKTNDGFLDLTVVGHYRFYSVVVTVSFFLKKK